jgi:hypothetical protein
MSDLTWPALLAHWTALAQSSLALPRNAEGERWRAAVPAIIGLQAITHALGDLDKLAPGEDRAAAQDKAAVGIQNHAAVLHQLWRGEPLHEELIAMVDDARAALSATKDGGLEWRVASDRLVVDHPAELVEALLGAGFDGDLYLPVPGTVLFKTSPAAFCRGSAGQDPAPEIQAAIAEYLTGRDGEARPSKPERVRVMRQVYRQFDFGKGGVVRDLVQAMDAELPAGQAQLVPAILNGEEQPVTLPIPGMADVKPVPVVFEDSTHTDASDARGGRGGS